MLNKVGRGECSIADGVFRSKGSYACFGNPEWKNYTMSFKARAPQEAEQVQIWAGFRANNRFDRYVVGIKGGLQNESESNDKFYIHPIEKMRKLFYDGAIYGYHSMSETSCIISKRKRERKNA